MLKSIPELKKRVTKLSAAKRKGRGSTVNRLAKAGQLLKLRPGVYRPANRETWMNQDLIDACEAVPEGVICLISALAYHGLTTAIPSATWIAIPRAGWAPRMEFPTRFIRMGERAYTAGIETVRLEGTRVRIYNKAKCVCDALRFREKVGVEVAFEALKTFLRQGGKPDELIKWEEICRVKSTLRGYLEAILA